MGFPFVGYQSNVPQLDIQVDRVKAKAQGVALANLLETLQVYLGSSYVNDFNLFGRTWRVYAQADGDVRRRVEDVTNLKTRNDKGEMVPIGSMVKISQTYGPDAVLRYNGYPAADFIGEANPAMLSSAQAMGTMAELARQVLPNGMTIEWTDLSFQEATQVAFIAGTIPLVLSHGAGAEVRSATGVTVFAGMIGVILFGLFLTSVFYVGLRRLSWRKPIQHGEAALSHG
jgi:multidrug efflux pump subunit AcrB